MLKRKAPSDKVRRRLVRPLRLSLLTIAIAVSVYLYIDFRGPYKIPLRNDTAFGFPCLKARDLVVQEYDKDGNLWATRGMKIYKLKNGDAQFTRIAHVPTGVSIFWLRDFSIVRKLLLRPECIEMTSTGNGDICAMSAGRMWLLKHGEKKFRRTLKLAHYGFGDQGLRNDGLLDAGDSLLFIGEYYQNPNRSNVNLLKSKSNLMGWMPAYEFQPGQIRHIHAIQKDPYTEKLWICTGDSDKESMIGWSDDDFKTIRMIGQGSQIWRVCQLVFTRESILWGTDTDSEELGGIYKWSKKTGELRKCISIDGAIFYGTQLKNGTIVMSTNRQGLSNEKDDKVRLYIISEEGQAKAIECGTWNHKKPGFWFKHALLRLQRNQGASSLGITCLNQKEFPESELVIISEESLHSVLDTSKSTSGKPL